MGGSYTADEQAAAVIAGGIADGPTDIKVGTSAMAASAVTSTVAHGLTSTPDFVLLSREAGATTWASDSTTLTFTRAASTAASVVSYIIGYTA